MSEGVIIALIGGTASLLVAVLVPYIHFLLKKMEEKRQIERQQDKDDCQKELAEMREDNRKHIEHLIQKYRGI